MKGDFEMYTFMWAEMSPEEQKICLIFVGILVIGLTVYGVFHYFKDKKYK